MRMRNRRPYLCIRPIFMLSFLLLGGSKPSSFAAAFRSVSLRVPFALPNNHRSFKYRYYSQSATALLGVDCLNCADGGTGPASKQDFLGCLCQLPTPDGVAPKFPAVANRYTLFVIAGCPFAARPWSVLAFYGLCEAIRVVKLFPASYEDGWFFTAQSDGEKELVQMFPEAQVDPYPDANSISHLRQLYLKASPNFEGAISVPLLWDNEQDTAVSNSSLGLAEMIAKTMRQLATQNANIDLFPDDKKEEHDALIQELHTRVTTAVYQMNGTRDGPRHDRLVNAYYQKLDELEDRLSKQHYLMGDTVVFADLVLWISLVRLDLAYQWRFGLGRKNVRDNYPILWQSMQRLLREYPTLRDLVLPRDIMALYFLTPKWVASGNGRTLPQVPLSWEEQMMNTDGDDYEGTA